MVESTKLESGLRELLVTSDYVKGIIVSGFCDKVHVMTIGFRVGMRTL